MSYKRRQVKRAIAEHEFYESPSGNMEAWSGEEDSLYYDASFPGPRETRILDSDNYRMGMAEATLAHTPDTVEWDIGGIRGDTKTVGSVGVTDPQTVETHTWDRPGEMAVIRRLPDTNYGPVGTSDHNSLLSLLYAMQETAAFFPNDVSQIDVIRAV